MKFVFKTFVFAFIAFVVIQSCQKETFITDSSARLQFSKDTVQFDTVFTTITTTTRQLKVYNPYKKSIKISSIYLSDNSKNFQLNIDGVASNSATDVVIAPNDSMFIFVQATLNTTNISTPTPIETKIIFQVNGNQQDVVVVAWGQDANIIRNQKLDDQTWTADKPYLIYGYAELQQGKTLTIEAGCKIYFHDNSSLYVSGTIKANGTIDKPIVFQGDRIDNWSPTNSQTDWFDNLPGQWGGIVIRGKNSDSQDFNYVTIKNSNYGIWIDSLADKGISLKINNTKIEHVLNKGLSVRYADILVTNSLIADCGGGSVDILGGTSKFYHCTIANYWSYSQRSRTEAALSVSNYFLNSSDTVTVAVDNAYFADCIIYGYHSNELDIKKTSQTGFNYQFENCLFKVPNSFSTSDVNHFVSVIKNQDDLFSTSKLQKYDYQLDTLSFAKDKGSAVIVRSLQNLLEFDIKGNSRLIDLAPDLGAYERKE